MAEGKKTMTPAKPGGGKGLMVPPPGSQKKPPVLLREDLKYALGKISSIIGSEDYEDLGNHSTEAMGETGLFSIAQVRVHRYSFIYYSLLLSFFFNSIPSSGYTHDEGLDGLGSSPRDGAGGVCEKARLTDEELLELKSWKVVTEQKLKLAEQARDEYQRMTEELKTVLEDKENELRLVKEKAVQEYRDSDALLTELGTSYNDGFDDALRQAKALYPKLDFSTVNINVAEAIFVQPDASDDTAELFAEERPVTVVTNLHAEDGKTHEARDPVAPDV